MPSCYRGFVALEERARSLIAIILCAFESSRGVFGLLVAAGEQVSAVVDVRRTVLGVHLH